MANESKPAKFEVVNHTAPRFCLCGHGFGAHAMRGCSAPKCHCIRFEAKPLPE